MIIIDDDNGINNADKNNNSHNDGNNDNKNNVLINVSIMITITILLTIVTKNPMITAITMNLIMAMNTKRSIFFKSFSNSLNHIRQRTCSVVATILINMNEKESETWRN